MPKGITPNSGSASSMESCRRERSVAEPRPKGAKSCLAGECAECALLFTRIFSVGKKDGESQRDSDPKPRVARNELPWENCVRTPPTPTGLRLCSPNPG